MNNLINKLFKWAKILPNRSAIIFNNYSLSYSEMWKWSRHFANYLQGQSLSPGSRIIFSGEPTVYTVCAYIGAISEGHIIVGAKPTLSQVELRKVIQYVSASLEIDNSKLEVELKQHAQIKSGCILKIDAPPPIRNFGDSWDYLPETAGAIFYTSGSTGESKGAWIGHNAISEACSKIAAYLEICQADRVLSFSGLASDFGFYNIFVPLFAGACAVYQQDLPKTGNSFLRTMNRHGITGLHIYPSALTTISSEDKYDNLSNTKIRYISTSGHQLHQSITSKLMGMKNHLKVFLNYGCVEFSRISYLDPKKSLKKPRSVGKPLPGVQIYLIDKNGCIITKPYVIGELAVSGPLMMKGYWKLKSANLYKPKFANQHMYFTGDLFYCDDDGDLFFECRKQHRVEVNGKYISLRDLESTALDTGLFADITILSTNSPQGQNELHAFVVIKKSIHLSPKKILAKLTSSIDCVDSIKSIRCLNKLPTSYGGKRECDPLRYSFSSPPNAVTSENNVLK